MSFTSAKKVNICNNKKSFFAPQDPPMLRSSVHQSRVSVNMTYFGKKVHLSHDRHDTRDEVKVFQQHCGGENLCVYKGLLHQGGQCSRAPPTSSDILGRAGD